MTPATLVAPRTLKANIEYRVAVRKWATQSQRNRDWLMDRCANDFFFWLETFAWIYEPRLEKDMPLVLPFIPWEHQRAPMQKIIDLLGYEDIGMEKARGEGASWMCLMIIMWRWLFHSMESYGLVSINEMAADNPEDPNSLGWKLDWQISKLPKWMIGTRAALGKKGDYSRNVSKHTWINLRNGSTITAYPCTGDLASGGRKTAFFMDELAKFDRGPDEEAMSATEPITNCRLLVSTPKGQDGAYYRCMTEPSSMTKIILDWTHNPTRNKNMFRVDLRDGKLYSIEEDGTKVVFGGEWADKFFEEYLPILQRRGFPVDLESKIWSPWYVSRCLRPSMTPKKIAQEYDRDYGGSSSRFFPSSTMEMLIGRASKPVIQGDVIWDTEEYEIDSFTKISTGNFKLWVDLEGKSRPRPPIGHYVLGVDVATGQGGTMSSCSAISILDRMTGKKVAEYTTSTMNPEKFAGLAVALAKWFKNDDNGSAYMVWENNGPGGSFRNKIMDIGFDNFHYRTSSKSKASKPTKEPGWLSNKDNKRELLSQYRFALIEGWYDNPSDIALRETLYFIEGSMGKIVFVSPANDDDDPTNEGENHGDRVIADSLSNLGMRELNGGDLGAAPEPKASIKAPMGSFEYRRQEWKQKQHAGATWSQYG